MAKSSKSLVNEHIDRFNKILDRLEKLEKEIDDCVDWLWSDKSKNAYEYAQKADEYRAKEIEKANLESELRVRYKIINPKNFNKDDGSK